MQWMPKFSRYDVSKAPENRAEFSPGSLNGLQRPRYFCGQLLTDEDLYAEQRYQMEKNKLYNRYLHGWGVVCGLKVTCHPRCSSKGHVLIEKGYAIDCCGSDIIACKDEELDVIGRIKECQPKREEDECAPGATSENDECKDLEKKYCLIIKYKEEESHPVTALKRDDEGCSVKRCEPSRIKEGYTFEVKECKDCDGIDWDKSRRRALGYRERKLLEGTFPDKLAKCLSAILHSEALRGYLTTAYSIYRSSPLEISVNGPNHQLYLAAYCGIRKHILETFKTGSVRCEMTGRLSDIHFPDYPKSENSGPENTEEYKTNLKQAFSDLLGLFYQQIVDCICLQLLYSCPECKEDDKVVLACITVQNDKITNICNLSRRQVMTFPKLFYWLPINEIIRKLIVFLCCELDLSRSFSQPAWTYLAKLSENNFGALRMPVDTIGSSLRTLSQNIINNIKMPEGVSVSRISDTDLLDAKKILKKDEISVEAEIPVERASLKDFVSMPFMIPKGAKVDLIYSSDKKIVGVRSHEEVEKVDEKTVKNLVKEFNILKADVNVMKSSVRRDLGSTIKLKANIEEPYQPLAIDLVKGLTEEMPPEDLKDVGDVRGKELKKAGIKSVRGVLEAVPADVSDATKEPIANATKYIDYAENLAMKVTTDVYSELKRAKVVDKKDLNKVDPKALAKKLKLSERTVRKVISDIRKVK